MKLLVVGGGGREHALAWKLAQSPRVSRVFVAPGNAGTALEDGVTNVDITDCVKLIEFAQHEHIALTVVGPEAPLAAGIVDAFHAAGLKIFGPTQRAAQLESSKDFAKAFMARHGIPSAEYQTFTDAQAARRYIDQRGTPIVIKADGLAAGKGVVVATELQHAYDEVDMMLVGTQLAIRHNESGPRVVIEDFLDGEEASFIVMVDGRHVLPLATSQDHKRLKDGDLGPNTGGMGAYSPAPVVTPGIHAKVMREVIQPVVAGIAQEGALFSGFLYAGLMISKDGQVKVLEFNCRLGDPETQPLILRLKSDLLGLIENALAGTLDKVEAEWDPRAALGVVLAAPGYPDVPRTGATITGLVPVHATAGADYHVFHSGTATSGTEVVVAGGRVLCVTALGHNVKMAQRRAYEIAEPIRFDGMQLRRDIGNRAAGNQKRGG